MENFNGSNDKKNLNNLYTPSGELDFKDRKDDAEKWGKDHSQEWIERHLTSNEKDTLEEFTKHPDYINDYLKDTKGELITNIEGLPVKNATY